MSGGSSAGDAVGGFGVGVKNSLLAVKTYVERVVVGIDYRPSALLEACLSRGGKGSGGKGGCQY
jgi:hypothetical protein